MSFGAFRVDAKPTSSLGEVDAPWISVASTKRLRSAHPSLDLLQTKEQSASCLPEVGEPIAVMEGERKGKIWTCMGVKMTRRFSGD